MSGDPIRHFIVGTAGHVDHGKSALVRALTGTDPDRLPEEKARGITIDLGFAHLALPGLELGIVDVPGHEDFVKNMVAGVGAVDVALFVVAADDGWMPQTEGTPLDHRLPGRDASRGGADENRPRGGRSGKLGGGAGAAARIAVHGRADCADLGGERARRGGAADGVAKTCWPTRPRRATWASPGCRWTGCLPCVGLARWSRGTLTGGTLGRGQAVVVQPSGRAGHVRSVQNHGREVPVGEPGDAHGAEPAGVPRHGGRGGGTGRGGNAAGVRRRQRRFGRIAGALGANRGSGVWRGRGAALAKRKDRPAAPWERALDGARESAGTRRTPPRRAERGAAAVRAARVRVRGRPGSSCATARAGAPWRAGSCSTRKRTGSGRSGAERSGGSWNVGRGPWKIRWPPPRPCWHGTGHSSAMGCCVGRGSARRRSSRPWRVCSRRVVPSRWQMITSRTLRGGGGCGNKPRAWWTPSTGSIPRSSASRWRACGRRWRGS